jgi:hypothetical protein
VNPRVKKWQRGTVGAASRQPSQSEVVGAVQASSGL